jgi:two-component system, LytTR family, response regulator
MSHTPEPAAGMKPLSVLIVDDERPARDKLQRLLRNDARFVAVGEARDGVEALERIDSLRPELVILDIQMPGLNGFEMLDALDEVSMPSVVFCTASDEHALRAFEAHAVDYLLKPYDTLRFSRALEKAYQHRLGARHTKPHALLRTALAQPRERLTLKTVDGHWVQLALDEVVQLSAANKHTRVIARSGHYLVRQSLREVCARLDDRFVRVHRSDVVNVSWIEQVEPWDHGDALIRLAGGSSLVLTRTFRKELLARLERG